jgi:type 1 glutamine amidotransferase
MLDSRRNVTFWRAAGLIPAVHTAGINPAAHRGDPIMRKMCLAGLVLLIAAVACWAAELRPIKVLIITGDNGHKWQETTPVLKEVLSQAGLSVDVTETPCKDVTPANLARYDVLLLNYHNTTKGAQKNPDSVWSDDNKEALFEAVKNGKGLFVFHFASAAFTSPSALDREYEKLIAGGWRKQGNHGKRHEFTVKVCRQHPITAGLGEFKHCSDELYQNSLILPGTTILATAYSDKSKDPKNTGKDEPMVWVASYGKGRVCNNVLGHDAAAMKGAGFRFLLIRGVQWAATGKATCPVPPELKGD